MEQKFKFINVMDRFDMTTVDGVNALVAKVYELYPTCTSMSYDATVDNGYIEVSFTADPNTVQIGDVVYQ